MIEIVYKNGVKRYFHWINEDKGFGYFRKKDKILRYPLPKQYVKKKE